MPSKKLPESFNNGASFEADINLKSLRVFVSLIEAGSMRNAARLIGASPSSISQKISTLEETLGAELFDRSIKPIALTRAGKLLQKHANRILEAASLARMELYEQSMASPKEFRLGIIDDLDATVTPKLLMQLSRKFPGCSFTTFSGRSDELSNLLKNREADLVITADDSGLTDGYEAINVMQEPFVLACARGAVDFNGDYKAQLERMPFIFFHPKMPIGRLVAQHLRRLKLYPKRQFTLDATRAILAMVRDTRGWAMVTPLCATDSIRFDETLEFHRMPFAGISRNLHLVSRMEELGTLPREIAAMFAQLVAEDLLPVLEARMPWLAGQIRLYEAE